MFANQTGMIFLPHYKFYGAIKATDEQIEHSARDYLTHITSPDLNPQVVRKRMLEQMMKAGSA
ncbi:hypothetical protein [Paenibacillus ferrarius]|uniref:hypothetical protein n=1 Tax=Paenibacillus ferrarius TaxID=1469647 RepID=UPI003D2E148F